MVHYRLLLGERQQFVTSLTPATCQRRLHKNVARSSSWSSGKVLMVRGKVSRNSFRLTKRIDHQNWFQTQAVGDLTAIPDGTLISIRLRPSSLALAWYSVCFAWFVFAGCVSILASLILPSLAPGGPLRYAAMALIVLGFLSFVVWSGCRQARDEGPFLIQFLCQTLEAQDSVRRLPPELTGVDPDRIPESARRRP